MDEYHHPNTGRTRPARDCAVKEGNEMTEKLTNVVLVHGGFVDGSGWQPVYRLLKADGCTVGVVQNPTLSLEGREHS